MIERKIIIALITSTAYLKKIRPVWDSMLIESSTARILANWCIAHFDKYSKAPNKEIETVFFQKVKEGLDKEIAEEIEEDILPDLSEESTDDDFDLDFIVSESLSYFKARQLTQLSDQITNVLEKGQGSHDDRVKQAEELRANFKPINTEVDDSLDLRSEKAMRAMRRAFTKANEPIIKFPKQLGQFWNSQFVPGAFISFLAPEKRGKTFLLLEIAYQAVKQGRKAVFFQAGDMNESEQLKRFGIFLNKRSNLEKYCAAHFAPVRDCIYNQLDTCNKPERECDFGVFSDMSPGVVGELSFSELKEAYSDSDNEDYKPCFNCLDYDKYKLGAVWLKKIPKVTPITHVEAVEAAKNFFKKYKGVFKLATYANGTLSFNKIDMVLDNWQAQENFIADVILIDYMDIMDSGLKGDFRHQENQKWKDARKLSQTKRGETLPLVISPTQADAKAYETHTLKLGNFSEDKRKYAHVTAMYGLNQDPKGREKAIGLLRINEIIIREGEYNNNNEVTVLQNLRQGRPFTGSFF